jgi:hypothetical protein
MATGITGSKMEEEGRGEVAPALLLLFVRCEEQQACHNTRAKCSLAVELTPRPGMFLEKLLMAQLVKRFHWSLILSQMSPVGVVTHFL